jgi:hypothetical protein
VVFGKGCHTGPFFREQEPSSLAFLAKHLVGGTVRAGGGID